MLFLFQYDNLKRVKKMSLYIFNDLNQEFSKIFEKQFQKVDIFNKNHDKISHLDFIVGKEWLNDILSLIDKVFIFCSEIKINKTAFKNEIINHFAGYNEEISSTCASFRHLKSDVEKVNLIKQISFKFLLENEKYIIKNLIRPYKLYALRREIEYVEDHEY